MTSKEAAELELIDEARARGISWNVIAKTIHPKMERWEIKRRYRELTAIKRRATIDG